MLSRLEQIEDTSTSRQLTLEELDQVSGGSRLYGTGSGGIFSSSSFGAASRFAGGLGLLYGSFQVGYSIGTFISNRYLR